VKLLADKEKSSEAHAKRLTFVFIGFYIKNEELLFTINEAPQVIRRSKPRTS